VTNRTIAMTFLNVTCSAFRRYRSAAALTAGIARVTASRFVARRTAGKSDPKRDTAERAVPECTRLAGAECQERDVYERTAAATRHVTRPDAAQSWTTMVRRDGLIVRPRAS